MNDEPKNTYWMQVFSENTWHTFLNVGGHVTGFSEARWNYIQQIKPGDILLCYLSKLSKWVGILKVQSEPYLDTSPIWEGNLYPCRIDVSIIARLPVEKGIPIKHFIGELSILRKSSWSLHFVSSPRRWKVEDAQIVETAILKEAAKGEAQPFKAI